ncbi:MAG: pyridoxamine 5'-phosphate oxidase [Kordiimonas sp.]|nr:pyridoxamine 5'-phosphate oxidase [Kordiimonas sp.]
MIKAVEDPFSLFAEWYTEAQEAEDLAEAMSLATVDAAGQPSVRMVLLKAADQDGFVFYTNLESRKGQELKGNNKAALCFHWKSLKRQVRIEGPVEKVSAEEADAYFASRHRDSKIGAWASAQSQPMQGRFEFETAIAKTAARFGIGEIPRPPFWSGYRLQPNCIEFWQDRAFRLHDRLQYQRENISDPSSWTTRRLYP